MTSVQYPLLNSTMATTSDRRRQGLLSTAPKFFKIIFDPLENTLRIPPMFLRRYGQNLPNRVFLKVPGGSPMAVSFIRRNGETLLQNGWKEFKHRYSLGFGHFLIFKYDGKSQFDVMIYDMSATEINYPSDSSDTEGSFVVLQRLSTNSSRGKGKEKGKAMIDSDSDSEGDDDVFIAERQQNGRKKLQNSTSEKCSGRQRKSTAYEKASALARTISNPFFISEMRPSYVSHRFGLNVPKKFATENLTHKCTNLTLQLRSGKTWSVRCNIGKSGRAKMSHSFKYFVKDNGLKEGDACIFEAFDDCVWNVFIFPG